MINKPEVLTVDVDGVEMEYLDYGLDNSKTIIFLHATGFSHWSWHPISRDLADDYRVISVRMFGHRDAKPKDGLSWRRLAKDLAILCEKLKINKPLVVGHSMGAVVATLSCALYKLDAGKMILIEPIFLPKLIYITPLRNVKYHPLASKSINRRNHWKDKEEAKEYLLSKKLFATWDPEMLDIYIEYGMEEAVDGGLTLVCHPNTEAAMFMGSNRKSPWPLLKKISCPVLIVEGEKSENRNYIKHEKAAGLLQNGALHRVDDAGHLIPMEKPKETLNLIRSFFSN
jgi:lipase